MVKPALEKSTRVLRTRPSADVAASKPTKAALISDVKPSAPKTKAPSTKAAGKRKSTETDDATPAPSKKNKKVTKDEVEVEEADEKPVKAGKKGDAKSEKKAVGKAKAEEAKVKKGKKKEEAAEVDEVDEVDEVAPVEAEVKSKATKSKKAKAKPKSPSPSLQDSDAENEAPPQEPETFEEADEHVFGFETDDDDSSDEEMNDEPDAIEVSKLPTIAKDDEVVKRKLEKAKRKPTENRGVIYLGRIPHGFYEAQMKSYFAQFGDVTRLRLSRNKRTGRSKHYAFIEFESSAVAQIVAETMDNYLLMGHILTCKVIPKDEVHPELWVGANRKWRQVPNVRVARVQHNKPRTAEDKDKAEKRLLKRQAQRKRKLEETGIKYDFEAVAYKKKSKADS